ncbi:biotin transporter BioY [Microbacterium sp. NPDC055521]
MTPDRRPLSADLARIAVFAALVIVLGTVMVPLPSGVPITGQTLGVMLAGLVLGARRAPLAILLVLALAAIGLPVLAGGRGGLGAFVGPTAGYLAGWVAGAIVIGLIAHSGRFTWWRAAIGAVVGGIVVVYLFGIPVQAAVTGVPLDLTALSSVAFLPGDLIKATLATVLAVALRRAYPRAFPTGPGAPARALGAGAVAAQ